MKKYLNLIISVAIIVLETLPVGVVLRFGNPNGEPFHNTFSYFDLTPFGYANFAPILTVILSLTLLIACVINCIKKNGNKTIFTLSVIGFILTFIPALVYGIEYLTWVAVCIAILFLAEIVLS